MWSFFIHFLFHIAGSCCCDLLNSSHIHPKVGNNFVADKVISSCLKDDPLKASADTGFVLGSSSGVALVYSSISVCRDYGTVITNT